MAWTMVVGLLGSQDAFPVLLPPKEAFSADGFLSGSASDNNVHIGKQLQAICLRELKECLNRLDGTNTTQFPSITQSFGDSD